MRTTQFVSNTPISFSLEDEVANALFKNAHEYSKKTTKSASSYVNRLIKAALENKDILEAAENGI